MSKRNGPRYSTSIKLKVIKEIEEKKYSVPEAKKVRAIFFLIGIWTEFYKC